jgi:hypothetical protein
MIRTALTRWLHLDEPAVSDAEHAELDELRAEVDAQRAEADITTSRIVGLSRYFVRVNDRNHLAERFRAAMHGR